MIRRHTWAWINLLRVGDVCLIATAYILVEATVSAEVPAPLHTLTLMVLSVTWLMVAQVFGIYRMRRRMEWAEKRKALTISFVLFYLISSKLATKGLAFSAGMSFVALIAGVLIYGLHLIEYTLLGWLRAKGFNQRRVLIYGAGRLGQAIADAFVTRPSTGFKVVGFLDDRASMQQTCVCCGEREIPVLGGGNSARELILHNGVHEVIAALPTREEERVVEFVRELADLNVNVSVAPDISSMISVQAQLEDLWGIPLIRVRQPVIEGFDAFLKRAFDLAVAVATLIVTAPLMALTALLIKLDSRGPVIFSQERIGRNGKPFRMYKFRTMVPGAEALLDNLVDLEVLKQEPAFKVRCDPRVTRVGGVLRRTSLDELPQLVNVLFGHMSLVGPRPEERRIVALYSYEQRQRLAVKPGITGPMQVNGRGASRFEHRLALELDYIRGYSFVRDLELLAKTVPAVLTGRGAY